MALETALAFGTLMVVLLAAFHAALYLLASEAAADAANESLEVIEELNGTSADAQGVASEILDTGIGVSSWSMSATGGDDASVNVTAESVRFVPFLPTSISVTVGGPGERFIPEADR